MRILRKLLYAWDRILDRLQNGRPALSAEEAARRVDRGARVLDRLEPGWHARIDEERLEIGRGDDGILAQLFGSYRRGLIRLWVVQLGEGVPLRGSRHRLGLESSSRLSPVLREQDREYLDQAWREEIRRRLEPAGAASDDADSAPGAAVG